MSAPIYDSVMLVLNDVSHDGRVRREAAALAAAGWRVLVIGTQRSYGTLPDEEIMQGFTLRRVRYARFGANKRRPWRWFRHGLQAVQIIRALNRATTRAYHAHDFPALLLITLAQLIRQRSARVVYDSHELYLFQPPVRSAWVNRWHELTRPAFMAVEQYLARRAGAVITVSDPISRVMASWYRIPRPAVILNTIDPVREQTPAPVDLRAIVGAGRRCIVHTGDLTNRGRCLTELVQATSLLPNDIALVFVGADQEAGALARLAQSLDIGTRVFFVPPVRPEEVPMVICGADAAAVLLRSDLWHIEATLPAKLFEAVAAGLPIVASPTFALARIVRQFDLGIVASSEQPAAIADAINCILSPDQQAHYRAQVKDAQHVLNGQTAAAKLDAIYRSILR